MADTTYTYAALIGQAVTDFDNIWSALKTKTGLKYDEKTLGSVACPTSEYHTLIGQLTYVNGYTGSAALNAINAYDTAVTKNSTSAGVVLGENGYTVSAHLIDAGYYTSTPTISTVVEATDVNLKALLASETGITGVTLTGTTNGAAYEITGSSTLLGTVTVDKGDVTTDLTNNSVTAVATLSNEITLGSKAASTASILFEEASSVATGDYYIKVSSLADVASGNATVAGNIAKTEGYIDGEDIPVSLTKAITKTANTGSAETYIKIPKGGASASLVDSDVDADISESLDSTLGIDSIFTETDTGIEISPSISGVKVKSVTNEGYVEANTTGTVTDVNVDITDVKKYIKTTTLDNLTKDSFTTKTIAVDANASEVTTLGSATGAYTLKVDADYVKNETLTKAFLTTASRTITIDDTATFNIKKGSVAASAAITGYVVGGDDSILDSNGAYEITITPTVTPAAKTSIFSEGYIKSEDVTATAITTAADLVTKSIKIAQGSVSIPAPVLTTTLTDTGLGSGDAGNDATTTLANIFKTTQPTTGDYYTVTTSIGTPTTGAGYITSSDVTKVANGTSTYYIPKATFEWVSGTNEDDEKEEYLQIKTPGYVPSGKIFDIAGTSLTENNASISLNYDFGSLDMLASATAVEGYTAINVLAGSIDAGYISDSKGTITNTLIHVKNGSISGAPSLVEGSKTGGTSWVVSGSGENKKYTTTVSGTIAHGTTLGAGYVSSSSVRDGTYSIDVELDEATVTRTAHSVTGSMSHNGIAAAAADDTTYKVEFNISECNSTIATSRAGYLASDRTITLTDNAQHGITGNTFYIKSGSTTGVGATLTSDTVAFTTPDFSAATGDYTISVSGSATANISIPEGYYPADSSVSKTVTGISESYTLARGAGTASVIEGKNTIASDSVVYYTDANKVSDISHVSITSTPAAKAHVDISRDGYIKDTEIANSSETALGTTTIYIESFVDTNSVSNTVPEFKGEDETSGEKTYYNVTIGDSTMPTDYEQSVQVQRIETEATYMSNDVKVSVGAHTMGSSVIAKLKELENRLAGYKANGTTIA